MDIRVKALIETLKTVVFSVLFGVGFYFFIDWVGLPTALITLVVAIFFYMGYISYKLNLHRLEREASRAQN